MQKMLWLINAIAGITGQMLQYKLSQAAMVGW